jgi:WD40 repeat protein
MSSVLYLDNNGGSFFDSKINGEYGLLSTMKSLSIQKKSSKSSFNVACFNEYTGEFILSDEQGSIYHVSLKDNYYHLLRHSRSPISAMVFVQSRCDQLVVSYENGIVVIIDILTKSIIGTLESSNSSTVKLMKSHIEKSMLATCTEDGTISLWDLRPMQCIRRIKLSEKIIDFNFEHDGELIVIILENSGAYIYRTSDFQLQFTCPIPLSERKPTKWTSYCLYYHNLSGNTDVTLNYSIMVSGDNGMIYIWHASREVGNKVNKNTVNATLSSIIELPVKVSFLITYNLFILLKIFH